ncbi:MAG TPA: Na+/H+ antiporter NhaA [Terriglobales bacterium]|nr:Na+/H+ antiporter NhaA [Terriglobales bacterium]
MHVPPRSRGTTLAKAQTSYAAKKIVLPLQRFFHTETTSGLMLLAATAAALVWANFAPDSYEHFWETKIALQIGAFVLSHSLHHWINDALMVIFFFVVGLEIKREFAHGELSGWKRSALPVICAFGGMVVPATIYALFNAGTPASSGWGIPMATDIAFALGVLALVGDRIPSAARVFLLALATVDDIGAILVIAVFYTSQLSWMALVWAVVLVAVIVVMQRLGVQSVASYVPLGVFFWLAVLASGVHATIAGVILGLLTPTKAVLPKKEFADEAECIVSDIRKAVDVDDNATSEALLGSMEQLSVETEATADRLIRILHPWSGYVVLPLFALANAGVHLNATVLRDAIGSHVAQGIAFGLILGKSLGITLAAYLAVKFGLATMVRDVRWSQMLGVSTLAGIGFTVSIFITDLAFTDPTIVETGKIGVLCASLIAGVGGFALLRFGPRSHKVPPSDTLVIG